MNRRLLIDDMRDPGQYGAVDVARTYKEGMRRLSEGGWARVYFDNDLGAGQPEGWELVKWLMYDVSDDNWPGSVVVVSANPPAKANIESKLKSMGYERTGERDRGHEVWSRAGEEPMGPRLASAGQSEYPAAGATVSGLRVLPDIPNTSSISSSFNQGEYEVLNGIREVPLDDFDSDPKRLFYAADDFERVKQVAREIETSKSVKPLIVVTGESEGPYILEGAHRLGALHELDKRTFPALVVEVADEHPSAYKVAYNRALLEGTRKPREKTSSTEVPMPSGLEAWFGDSKVVDNEGKPLRVYHGTGRPDRIGGRFKRTRATSGPMQFFTDDPNIAGKYAEGKRDTSLEAPGDYAGWFGYKVPGSRSTTDIDRAWYFLPMEERDKISRNLPHVTRHDEDGNEIEHVRLGGPDEYGLTSKDHWDIEISRAKVLKSMGYDGIKDTGGKSGGEGHTVWIPFDEVQIKSAIGNIGKYDPTKRDIRKEACLLPSVEGVLKRVVMAAWEGPSKAAWETYYERYSEALDEAINNIVVNKPPRKLMPLNPARLKKIWRDYSCTGIVRDERGVDDILDDFFDKTVRIDVNNYLSGHTSGNPLEEFKERGIPTPKDIDDRIDVAIADIHGNWMISDYGINRLQTLIHNALTTSDYEQKLLNLDAMLNVVHQRSNLAAWFVQGGRGALEAISANDEDSQGGFRTASSRESFLPPSSVSAQAAKGLEYRRKAQGKGGLNVQQAKAEGIGSGVQRAVNLKNRDSLSTATVKRMKAFFDRHEKNKSVSSKHKDEPWKDRGYVAWLLWGGDPGYAWSTKMVERMDRSKQASRVVQAYLYKSMPFSLSWSESGDVPLYKDPTPSDIEEIVKEDPNTTVRAAVDSGGNYYAWNGKVMHRDVELFLHTQWSGIIEYDPHSSVASLSVRTDKEGEVERYLPLMEKMFPRITKVETVFGDYTFDEGTRRYVIEPIMEGDAGPGRNFGKPPVSLVQQYHRSASMIVDSAVATQDRLLLQREAPGLLQASDGIADGRGDLVLRSLKEHNGPQGQKLYDLAEAVAWGRGPARDIAPKWNELRMNARRQTSDTPASRVQPMKQPQREPIDTGQGFSLVPMVQGREASALSVVLLFLS